MVAVANWQHSINGTEIGIRTRDFQCQTCGAKFTLYPRLESTIYLWLGLVFSFAVVPLSFAWVGHSRLRRHTANPVVPGAPRPTIRFRVGPPGRTCGHCGDVATLTSETQHEVNFIPSGTEYVFACRNCECTFTILSWGRLLGFALTVIILLGAAAGYWTYADNVGWRIGICSVALVLALLTFGTIVMSIRERMRHPEAPWR